MKFHAQYNGRCDLRERKRNGFTITAFDFIVFPNDIPAWFEAPVKDRDVVQRSSLNGYEEGLGLGPIVRKAGWVSHEKSWEGFPIFAEGGNHLTVLIFIYVEVSDCTCR